MCRSRRFVTWPRAVGLGIAANLSLAAGLCAQQAERRWVVEDVVVPEPFQEGDEFRWDYAYPLVDVNEDGCQEWLMSGQNQPDPGYGRHGRNLSVVWQGPLRDLLGKTVNLWAHVGSSWKTPRSALMGVFRGGLMDLWITLDVLWQVSPAPVEVYSLVHRKEVGKVAAAPPPPGFQPMANYLALYSAGDCNGDGYGDVFYQSINANHLVTGKIDGGRLVTVWEDYQADAAMDSPTPNVTPSPPGDLNGDGIPDFISSVTNYYTWPGPPFYHIYRAYDGVTGQVLWEQTVDQPDDWNRYNATGADLDGDGIDDIVGVSSSGGIKALSGVDGHFIWQYPDDRILNGVLPPGYEDYSFVNPTFLTGIHGRPGEWEAVLTALWWYPGNPRREYHFGYAHLEGPTGRLVDYLDLPPDLWPWSPDPVAPDPWLWVPTMSVIGDVDRDGFVETGQPVFMPEYGTPPLAAQPMGFVILGMQTLFLPERADAGSQVDLEVSIPSAPRKEFYVLASDAFAGDGGVRVDRWKTHLADTPMLRYTLQHRPLQGALDAAGQGQVTMTLPGGSALVGRILFFKAVVHEPGRPDEVFTLSTLGHLLVTGGLTW